MAFTETWNSAFEALPADPNPRSEGASRMRQVRKAIRERGEIDHSWAGDADDGKHKQVTFVNPLGSDPANVTDEGVLYTKNVSSKAELFWKDEDGNVLQITTGGVFKYSAGIGAPDFTSSEQTLTTSTTLSVAHSLGALPSLVSVRLKCKTADIGYSVDEELEVSDIQGSEDQKKMGFSVSSDTTNVHVITGSPLRIINKSTHNFGTITAGNWKWIVRAWK